MAESIMRKIQPFTIGTKLSVPAVPKCPHFAENYLPSQALDNCKLQRNLNDQVSLYLGRAQMRPDGPQFSPVAAQVTRVERQQVEMAEEDQLNSNAASPTAFSRSIRKITISGSTMHPPGGRPKTHGTPVSENINNNNNVASKPLPKIIGVSCEHKPNSHFKVLLRKDGSMGEQGNDSEGASGTDCSSPTFQTPVLSALSPNREQTKGEDTPCGHAEALPPNDCCFSQRKALFNREILQAEAWIKGKLQELGYGRRLASRLRGAPCKRNRPC
ncbi:hypothetical protein AAFF_G00063020 [Aldrovandia affinis]|uniref:Uncharacterized protein n=1 Tax=Aldrovandia affinis TaxID=143900 RepID=A0AAD7RZW9_9TELE|nr:hypothetical protein AAFF_G00063020 [Aldrovandia affinis]